jgi:hypothetical protein
VLSNGHAGFGERPGETGSGQPGYRAPARLDPDALLEGAAGRPPGPEALAGIQICAITRFEANVLPWFGLPRSLPSR